MAKRNTSDAVSEAERRIEDARTKSIEILDLSRLGLTEVPESLGQLTFLTALNLSGNQLSSVPEWLNALKKLRALVLSGNQLSSVPESLGQLMLLISLDFSSNQLSSLPESLGQLEKLETLYFFENRLTSVPEWLAKLERLEILYLDNNQLKSVPDSLGRLARLQILYLNGNPLSSVPEWLGTLTGLRALGLSSNGLSSVPEWLGQLTRLQELYLSGNRLSSVPEWLGKLTQLRVLGLNHNRLAALPEWLGQLTKLERLYLDNNRLASLPESLGQLTALEELDLSSNPLRSLPRTLGGLSQLKQLFLHGNDGLGIPAEVLGPGLVDVRGKGETPADPSAILRYCFQVRVGKRPLNEVKFILMGRGGVGKTSLVNRLVLDTFIPNLAKTEGIQITQWPVAVDGETVRLNVWDFGGQEIMHATHQFFLTKRSLYLVVLSGREGSANDDAEYWLKFVASFGAGSPVIVVLNKMDEHPFDVNRRALRQKYPNIREFVATDCRSGLGIDGLEKAVCAMLSAWEAWRVDFPDAWFAIKERLSGMTESYLSFKQFQRVCRKHGVRKPLAHADLAGYLHDLGIALNYKDDPRLCETHVLNPNWVTGGIYRILNAKILADGKGVLSYDDLCKILPADSYPRQMHLFLLDLMRKFELCFPFADEPDRYFVPELLDIQQPEQADQFSPATCLGFEYQYPILPEGLLPRFIVRSHVLSEGQPRWRSGVMLQFEGCRALVKADVPDRRVRVLVDGDAGNRRRLLAVIRSDFARIHASIPELKPREMVPFPGRPDFLIDYQKLTTFELQRLVQFNEAIGGDVVDVRVTELLDDVDLCRPSERALAKPPLKVFYSYSHKDERLRNEMETHLKILQHRGLISPWHDRLIRPGVDWTHEIDVNLEIANIILLLVSADFIASEYCYAREMKRALERHEKEKARVIPVILRDVNWNGTPFAHLQALPKDAKAVTRWSNRDSAWRNVSEGIEAAIQSILGQLLVPSAPPSVPAVPPDLQAKMR